MKTVTHKKLPKTTYKMRHKLYGSENTFDSWVTVCNRSLEIAEEEAKRIQKVELDQVVLRLNKELDQLIIKIADDMIDTVEEIYVEGSD